MRGNKGLIIIHMALNRVVTWSHVPPQRLMFHVVTYPEPLMYGCSCMRFGEVWFLVVH